MLQVQENNRIYAGFFVRLFAFMLDLMLVNLMLFLIKLPVWVIQIVTGSSLLKTQVLFQLTVMDIIYYLLTVAYFVLLTYKSGATLGKRVMNLVVIDRVGRTLSFGAVLYRETIGRYLSSICLIGYLMIGAGNEKEGLHDILCDSRVIYRYRAEYQRANTNTGRMMEYNNPRIHQGQMPQGNPGMNAGQMPQGKPGMNAGQMPKSNPGMNAGQMPKSNPGMNAGQMPQGKPGMNAGQMLKSNPGMNAGQMPQGKPELNLGQMPNCDLSRNADGMTKDHLVLDLGTVPLNLSEGLVSPASVETNSAIVDDDFREHLQQSGQPEQTEQPKQPEQQEQSDPELRQPELIKDRNRTNDKINCK